MVLVTFEEYTRRIDWSLAVGRTELTLIIIVENDNVVDVQGLSR